MSELASGAPTPPDAGYQLLPSAQLPAHEHASLALGLGIIGMFGLLTCGAGFLLSPFALGYGLASRRAIREHPDQWRGEGMARAGIVLGAIGVVLLVLLIVDAVIFGIMVMTGTVHPTPDGGFNA